MDQLCCCCNFASDDHENQSFVATTSTRRRPGSYTSSRQFEAGAPTDKRWYHGGITDAEADRAIRSSGISKNGLYLVYDNPTARREYVLLVYVDNELHRFRIIRRRRDNQFVLGKDTPGAKAHESVRKLIKYHRGLNGKPLMLEDGRRVKLGDYVYLD